MRFPKFISPSAIGVWNDNREEYYLRYLAENRPPKKAQTLPMSIGSAFDAYVKSYLVDRLFGKDNRPQFAFQSIFEAQVENQNRDWARKHGKHAFEAYKKSGALANLMLELSKSSVEPRFEFKVDGVIGKDASVSGVPLLGKPDLYFVTDVGAHIIVDWKVNGYCAKSAKSPTPGYVLCRDGWDPEDYKRSRSHNMRHKNCHPLHVGGLIINIAEFMEDVEESWARQLCIYAWLLGEEVGSNFIICIEQLACGPGDGDYPKIRVAQHRMRASQDYQFGLIMNIHEMWAALHRGHIFTELTSEENTEKCKKLDRYYRAFIGTSEKDEWFTKMERG